MAFEDFEPVGGIFDGKTRKNNWWFAVVQFQLATSVVVPIRKYVHMSIYAEYENVDIGTVVSRAADFGRSVVAEALYITTAAVLLVGGQTPVPPTLGDIK